MPVAAAQASPVKARGLALSAAAAAVMSVLVIAVYFPVRSAPSDNTLLGIDYHQLHARRIAFAQESFAAHGELPAWYPRELMGTPFRANIHNFPFIPNRLALLWMDPLDLFAAGVILAAVLSALFTFAFARRLGMTPLGAAASGWTFACAGFFASRIMAGYLPLLEAYPALPLLLWRVEVLLHEQSHPRRHALRLGLLALATLCVVLAGHPQIPLYSIAGAGLYLLYRGWRRWRVLVQGTGAMLLGAACGGFFLWPMLQLIGRSTRVLALADDGNDVIFPYRRLLALVLPWRDGWPRQYIDAPGKAFAGYPNEAYFWDTVCYVGLAPLLAAVFLLARRIVRGRRGLGWLPETPWRFFALFGVLALVTALPAVQDVVKLLPGTILRSPSRQVYVTTFALALAVGVAADVVLRQALAQPRWRMPLAGVLAVSLPAHFVDLFRHDRPFVRMVTVVRTREPQLEQAVRRTVGDGRAAIDYMVAVPFNRELDDIGFFDSIMLARPYAALMDLSGAPPGHNMQILNGSELPRRALAATGVRLVMTTTPRPDLPRLGGDPILHVYGVPSALPRAAFFPSSAVVPLDGPEMHRRLRDPAHDVGRTVMLPPAQSAALPRQLATTASAAPTPAAYQRQTSDSFTVRVHAPQAGVLRILDAWDPGWTAAIDGKPADVLCADTTYIAVALPAGDHEVRLTYRTPGATFGIIVSLTAAALLAALLLGAARAKGDA
jgi:hypothetical protein